MFSVCFSYGSQLAKVEEQNTNIYIGDQVNDADSTVKHYWIGTGSCLNYLYSYSLAWLHFSGMCFTRMFVIVMVYIC